MSLFISIYSNRFSLSIFSYKIILNNHPNTGILLLAQLHTGGKAHFPHKGGDANVDF